MTQVSDARYLTKLTDYAIHTQIRCNPKYREIIALSSQVGILPRSTPLRLSTYLADSGFAAYEEVRDEGKRVEIYLDGQKIDHVLVADEELGFVRVEIRASVGRLQFDPASGRIRSEVRQGAIRMELRDRQSN